MVGKLGLVILLIGFLVWGARLTVNAFEELGKSLSFRARLALASVLVALSTSLPELFVSISSAVEKVPQIALGDLLGANLVNASLVIGVAALISGSLPVVGEFMQYEFAVAFLMGCSPLLLLLDGGLSRLDGAILIVIYMLYLQDVFFGWRQQNVARLGIVKHRILSHIERKDKLISKGGELAKLLLGIAMLIVSSDLLVRVVSQLASIYRINEVFIGLVVVSLGTTLPEIVLSVGATAKRQTLLVLGNLLGSIVTNATLIMGVLALIHPFQVSNRLPVATASISFVVIFSIFWLMARSKRKLERWEGVILIGGYLMYLGISSLLS